MDEYTNKKYRNDKYFLETSVIIKKLLGHKQHKKCIGQLLNNKKLKTSFFIFREFQRRIILPLIKFYFILKEEDSVKDAVDYFSDTEFSIRDLKTWEAVSHDLLTNYGNNKAGAIVRIRLLIDILVMGFINTVNKNWTPNQLKLTNHKPPNWYASDDELLSYKKVIEDSTDHLQTRFWEVHKGKLTTILDNQMKAKMRPKKNFGDFFKKEDLFKSVLDNPSVSDLSKNRWRLADLLISIDCPENNLLVSLDRTFLAYCFLLNKDFCRVPSLRGLKKNEQPIFYEFYKGKE